MMTDEHPIVPLDSRRAWDCPWYGVRTDRIRLPDGSEGVYNVIELPNAVWVVPVTEDGQIVLLWHYRYPLSKWIWELPAGGIRDSEPLLTAQQELREEAGGVAADWRLLMKVCTMKGIGNEYAYLYLATGVRLGATDHEPAEVMTIHLLPIAEVLRMARAGEIEDAQSVLALLLAEPLLVPSQ